MNTVPPAPVIAHPPPMASPPPEASKEEPWGAEDPLLWSARRARFHTLWGSAAIAFLVLLFGAGMYILFTVAIYEGDIEGHISLIILFLSPFILAIVGAVATGALARNVGRMSRQPLAPSGAKLARSILWFSVFLWIMLLVVFPLSLTITSGSDDSGDEPFPIGIITVLPVYIGFCVAIYTTGAAYSAWSKNNRVECMLIIGLAWAAFAMFLLLPAVVNSWNLGAENPDINWDSAVWWLRFGNLFPAITPWLIVIGLYFVNNRSISLLEDSLRVDEGPPPYGVPAGTTSADSCPNCGGSLSTHPKTLEVFCAACGWGLMPEADGPLVVDAAPAPTHAEDQFVEQVQEHAPAVATDAATAVAATTVAATTVAATPTVSNACNICGGELAVLTQTQQVYCTGCGAGLPGQPQQADQAPAPSTAPPAAPPAAPPPVPAPAPAPMPPPAPSQPAPALTSIPTQPPSDDCLICGARVAVHPRTGERFCPACGAGLRPE